MQVSRNQALGMAAAAVALVLAWSLFVYIPGGSRGVLEEGRGTLRVLVQPGLYLRWPPFASLSLYPASALRLEGSLQAASREGAAVELRYALGLRLMDGGLESLHRERSGEPLEGFLRSAVEAAAAGHALERSLPELLTPAAIRELSEALQRAFDPLGVWVDPNARLAWEVPLSPEREAQLAALRARVRDTGLKILFVGLDGADWDLIDPLIERGRLPNLARLKGEGAWGTLISEGPMLSPLLWTTIATGRSPDVHGVMDFLMRDPASNRMVPISSSFRRVKALWNVLSDFGLDSDFVAWWATWPAERIAGTMVSDRLSYSLFSFIDQEAAPYGTTYPEAYLGEVRPRLISDRDITYDDVGRFVNVPREEFERLRAWARREPRAAYTHPVNHLTRILAAARNYHTIALDLLGRGPRRLTAVYYQGIDEINHRFAHFAPPRMDRITEEEFRSYAATLERFYEYQDEMLGELLERAGPESVVLVLSDHGFANGMERPRDFTPSIEGRPARWHTREGIRILAGAAVRPGPVGEGKLVDVAPTLLRLLGVPLADELEGGVWEQALDPAWLERFPADTVASYESLGRDLSVAASGTGAGGQEFVEALIGLGYLEAPGGNPAQPAASAADAGPPAAVAGGAAAPPVPEGATASYHSNLASFLLRKKDFEGAEREFRRALAKIPHFGPALGGLAEIEQRRGRSDEALSLLIEGIDYSPDPDDTFLVAATRLYLRLERAGEGAEKFEKLERRLPRRAAPRVCRGILLLGSGQERLAEEVLQQALEVDPGSIGALQELFELYREQERLPALERALLAAQERNPRSLALRNWLAWVREARGDLAGAEDYFRQALRDAPGHLETLSNLGSLLIDAGRAQEAVLVLQQALEHDVSHWQTRVNLVIGLGKLGRLGEARQAYDAAGVKNRERPALLNALAYVYYLNGERDLALETVERSLAIEPEQPEARRLREALLEDA
ncbi:MAG: alkaline phosphatase family protein [Acidobacteriota bacterium]